MSAHVSDRRGRPREAVALALVGGVALLVYAPGVSAGFVGDDFMILHRLGALGGPGDILGFFRAGFFEYYRPLGFVAHAIDYAIGGPDPRQFHLTNLLLHTINTVLVMLLGRELSPRSLAGPVSGLLFGLHASNHEAVMWVSARFDLLATTFSLAALWWMIRRPQSTWMPAALFALAVLSKESAVALPLAAAGWAVFRLHAGGGEAVRRLAPWIVALGVYAALRSLGGGLPAAGGPGRAPKLIAFVVLLALVVMLAEDRWMPLRARLNQARGQLALATALLLAAAASAAALSTGAPGRLAAEKLAVAGFAIVHLLWPAAEVSATPFYLDPSSPLYWLGGLVSIVLAAAIVLAIWQVLVDDDRMWFLAALLIATLLPISALTEGKRYLYLPSAAVSLIAGVLVGELRGRRFKGAVTAVALVLTISTVEITAKIRDWQWAGSMTAEGARLVDEALAPSCGTGHVVFLTSPVGLRGVYNHFYYETFEPPRGCRPELFQVLIRMVRIDQTVDVRWEGADRVSITANDYQGGFALSPDLRQFDRTLNGPTSLLLETPLGLVRAEPAGQSGQQVTLTLSHALRANAPRFFYYSGGRIHALARPER